MMERPANVPATIVETDTVQIAREIATVAMEYRCSVHLIGRAGTGKSTALWHVARELGGSYCEVSQATKSTKGLFELLLDSIGRRTGKKYLSDIADEVYYYFQPRETVSEEGWTYTPRLLVVDEVQTLEASAFRELLRVQEKCEVALVLAGNAERLAGRAKDANTWEQIESRISIQRPLPGPSRRDCDLIGSAYNVEGKDAYAALAAFGMRTNLRDLTKLLQFAAGLTGGTGIRLKHLEDALRLRKPKSDVLKLLRTVAA
ncbi:AAA family ATPase [Allorhizobium undicola]|uniref:AAA family ATPase n=1 Tax=Allorhizobium undicola TaxID=78527 RepID=UPI003D342C7D